MKRQDFYHTATTTESVNDMKAYLESVEATLAALESRPEGLSEAEAAARLEKHGPNKLKEAEKQDRKSVV